jgi:hypothetical protein
VDLTFLDVKAGPEKDLCEDIAGEYGALATDT